MCNGKFDYVISLRDSGIVLKDTVMSNFEGAVCVEQGTSSTGVVRLKFQLENGKDALVLIETSAQAGGVRRC